nr:uncharacterized protein LOC101472750 [Maylandia zebra]
MDREIALEALGAVCNAQITSVQNQRAGGHAGVFQRASFPGSAAPTLSINSLICAIADGDQTCPVSRNNFARIQRVLQDGGQCSGSDTCFRTAPQERSFIIDESEFFDPTFDYDFSGLQDTETYYRGGEVYERPSGWYRFALKVLNKYDGNTWLGTRYRSTASVPGEWPVSYHGTSKEGAGGIIEGFYKPGPGQTYGRGIYSTPYVNEAVSYAKTFTCQKNGKQYKVILQNRINSEYRQKHNNDKYWLVPIPSVFSAQEEQAIVEQAIRPYGLLLKEV